MSKKNNRVVIAIFDDQNSAEKAMDELKTWTQKSSNIKLGAVGTLGQDGDEMTTKLPRQIVKGVFLGLVVGLIVGVLISSLNMIIAAVVGAFVGGLLGAYFKKSTTMNQDEKNQVYNELSDGKVAVMATVSDYQMQNTKEKLDSLGGKLFTFTPPADMLADVT